MPYKLVDGRLVADTNKNYLSQGSSKRDLFDALKEQVKRAESAEAERDELKIENERLHAELVKVNQQLSQIIIGSIRP